MTSALSPDGVVELAVVQRSGFDESRHFGAAVLTDRHGTAIRELGDVRSLVFPRSSLKPFQAIGSLRSGAPLTGLHLAIVVASHAGTPAHVRLVREVLAASGLDESALRCVAAYPSDEASRDSAVRAGDPPLAVTMNCSGKHAGFLSACVAAGWSTGDYLDAGHPVQLAARSAVERLTGASVEAVGVDGCGAPVYATTIAGIALGMSRIARGEDEHGDADEHGAAVMATALANGWVIDGPGRPNTVVIQELGLFTKGGAEGFMLIAAPSGETAAVKIVDGAHRAATVVALELLAQGGVIDPAEARRVSDLATPTITGGGRVVGRIRPAF